MMFHLALPSALFTFKEEMPVLALLFRFPNASTKKCKSTPNCSQSPYNYYRGILPSQLCSCFTPDSIKRKASKEAPPSITKDAVHMQGRDASISIEAQRPKRKHFE